MKSLKIISFLMGMLVWASAGSANSKFRGEISDTQCAMNVHSLSRSHEEMLTKQTIGTDAASCARACVRRGGEWVLKSGDKVYRLNNQTGVEDFAGQKVEVTGTLDSKTNSIDNTSIELPASRSSRKVTQDHH
jgi:type 1 fimbria pilin